MGMFDTIQIRVKCPICNKKRPWEVQTKDLDQSLGYYTENSIVTIPEPFDQQIEAIGNCPICQKLFYMDIPIINNHFGTPFNVHKA